MILLPKGGERVRISYLFMCAPECAVSALMMTNQRCKKGKCPSYLFELMFPQKKKSQQKQLWWVLNHRVFLITWLNKQATQHNGEKIEDCCGIVKEHTQLFSLCLFIFQIYKGKCPQCRITNIPTSCVQKIRHLKKFLKTKILFIQFTHSYLTFNNNKLDLIVHTKILCMAFPSAIFRNYGAFRMEIFGE